MHIKYLKTGKNVLKNNIKYNYIFHLCKKKNNSNENIAFVSCLHKNKYFIKILSLKNSFKCIFWNTKSLEFIIIRIRFIF